MVPRELQREESIPLRSNCSCCRGWIRPTRSLQEDKGGTLEAWIQDYALDSGPSAPPALTSTTPCSSWRQAFTDVQLRIQNPQAPLLSPSTAASVRGAAVRSMPPEQEDETEFAGEDCSSWIAPFRGGHGAGDGRELCAETMDGRDRETLQHHDLLGGKDKRGRVHELTER